jgi:hypothetical protein
MLENDRRAGLGPWTLLGDEAQRLQILADMGRYEETLSGVAALRPRMAGLPERSEQRETVQPYVARELIIDVGHTAALALGRWEEALALNAENLELTRRRDAPPLEVARTLFNDYGPLLILGRVDEARALLLFCRDVFEQEGVINALAKTLNALADVEDVVGHSDQAVALGADALRLGYLAGTPEDIAVGHFNFSTYLRNVGVDPVEPLAHRLAAAIIRYQSNLGALASSLQALRTHLDAFGDRPVPSWAEVCELVDRRDGVRLSELVDRLPARAADGSAALAEVIRLARELDPDHERLLRSWDPVLSALLAAHAGDQDAVRVLEQTLANLAEDSDWTALSNVVRRLAAGDRDPQLLAGLDPVDTVIAQRAVAALDGRADIDSNAWHRLAAPADNLADQLNSLAATVIAAAQGDSEAADALRPMLADLAADESWRTLAGVLHRILDGDRDLALLDGLDPTDTAVVTHVLTALADEPYSAA